jgi:hypothetical protein
MQGCAAAWNRVQLPARRSYQVDLPHYDSNNIHSINRIRDKITLSNDTLTGEQIFVDWSQISIMRIIS